MVGFFVDKETQRLFFAALGFFVHFTGVGRAFDPMTKPEA